MIALECDLEKIEFQESRLIFKKFDVSIAWVLGCELRKLAESLESPVAIDILLHDRQLFHCAMKGATPENADWVRRKRSTVLRCHKSSYGIGQKFALEGGCCIGAITVSDLPRRQDHMFVVEVLAKHLGQNLAELALKEPA
jgi:uncharacterized protein (UPF0303 family)